VAGYIIVALLAVAVGVAVYWVAMRFAPVAREPEPQAAPDTGFVDDVGTPAAVPTPVAPPEGGAYIPVSDVRPSWQRRVVGLIGLLIAIVVGAAAAAFALYLLVEVITSFVTEGTTG
jgi:hypothetical protein